MSEFTNRLKAQAPLGEIIGEYVALRPAANGFIGLCPFHGEKTPSFHVHTARQFYYCFGCHAHGDIFAFLMQMKKLSFAEAVETVAERLGIEVPRSASNREGADGQHAALLRIHAAAAGFLERALNARDGASARAYLQNRDFSPAIATAFQLGYAPDGGRGLTLHLQEAGFSPELALSSGLCQMRRESTGPSGAALAGSWSNLYDRFRDRLMFPIADERGRVIAFGGRALSQNEKTPKYLNSPEHPLYVKGRVLYNLDRAKAAIRELGYVILVEGYFDCLRVFTAGFENVVASCGTALTAAQIAPLGRLARKAVINFDPDTAGAAAAERSIGLLLEEGFKMRIVVLEGGLDPDLFIRRHGRDAYAAALTGSRSFFDYLAERARRQFDLRHAEGKVAALNHLLPYLSRVHDPIVRQELAENCAAQLGVETALLSQQLLHAARERRQQLPRAAVAAAAELLPAERVVLRAWIEWEERRTELGAALAGESLLEGMASEALITQLLANDAASWELIQDGLDASLRALVAELLLDDAPLSEALVEGALESLRQRRKAAAVRKLQVEIQQAAAAGDREQVKVLVQRKAAWDSQTRDRNASSKLGN
ncbi:MAG TPA: DNA primase [Terriglobales bacterium]|jgi:DNA primase